jgi:hypothetical protein
MIILIPIEPIRPSGSGSSPNDPRFNEFSVDIALFLQPAELKEVALTEQISPAP